MNTILAYLVYIVWFSVPVLIGLFETALAEILYSNIVLGVCITMAVILAFKEPPVGIFEVPEEHTHHQVIIIRRTQGFTPTPLNQV